MPAQPPTIYVIAGCNGAGKTTFAKEFLPKEVKCLRFLNADEIARVPQRVKQGGHHVPTADIRRRFRRSLVHLVDDYLPLSTRWAVWDSRSLPATRLAISSVDAIESVRQFIET